MTNKKQKAASSLVFRVSHPAHSHDYKLTDIGYKSPAKNSVKECFTLFIFSRIKISAAQWFTS